MQSLHIDKLPHSETIPPQKATPEPEITNEEIDFYNPNNDGIEDFFSDLEREGGFSADTVLDENGEVETVIPETAVQSPDKEPMSEKKALDNTEVLFNLRETIQSYGLAYYTDGSFRTAEQYDYEPDEKRRLIKAWSRVIGHYNVNVSPWVDVLLTEAVCTSPLIALAYNNRKQRIELEAQRAEIIRLRNENAAYENQSNFKSQRADTKTQWKVDENGFFEYTLANSYIKKTDRKEKPELTPENYELLIKHNGSGFIEQVFKTGK